VHLAGSAVVTASAAETAAAILRFALGAAVRTASRGIGKPLLLMKLLFTGGEHKSLAAIAAS